MTEGEEAERAEKLKTKWAQVEKLVGTDKRLVQVAEDIVQHFEAPEVIDSAVQVLGDDTLRTIAQELLETVQKNATIDWSVKENVRAKMRVMVRRILRKHGYPPDLEAKATQTVLEQAELMAEGLAA